ncbi:MAG: hypothetical protein ACTSRH_06500 [Promethearchaeota archaeon]
MSESIEEFMVFELEDNGESRKIKIKQEELGNYLNPEQVLIIVREDFCSRITTQINERL